MSRNITAGWMDGKQEACRASAFTVTDRQGGAELVLTGNGSCAARDDKLHTWPGNLRSAKAERR